MLPNSITQAIKKKAEEKRKMSRKRFAAIMLLTLPKCFYSMRANAKKIIFETKQ